MKEIVGNHILAPRKDWQSPISVRECMTHHLHARWEWSVVITYRGNGVWDFQRNQYWSGMSGYIALTFDEQSGRTNLVVLPMSASYSRRGCVGRTQAITTCRQSTVGGRRRTPKRHVVAFGDKRQ